MALSLSQTVFDASFSRSQRRDPMLTVQLNSPPLRNGNLLSALFSGDGWPGKRPRPDWCQQQHGEFLTADAGENIRFPKEVFAIDA